MRNIKIAVVGTRGFPGVQGGVENHCENLYVHLAQGGYDITVFIRPSYVANYIHTYRGISLIPVDCPKNKYLEAFLHTFKSIIKAKRLNPDILHIHAIGPSLFTPLVKMLGMKVVVTHHGPDYKRKKWPLFAKIFLRFCEWAGIVFADEIIVISDNIADDIKRKYNRETTVIPNGVKMPSLSTTDDALEKYGLEKERYILSVGRFVPEKGFDYLIDAFNVLQNAGPGLISADNRMGAKEWKLVIVGDADHEDDYSFGLKAKASKAVNVVLTGHLTGDALKEVYSFAGLFVIPSYYEGLPIVLLEAMSYGLSCIASDIPANRCVEINGSRFFKAGDAGDLSEKIKEFIKKPQDENEKKQQLKMIAEKYDWDKIADETLKVYERAVTC